MKDYAYYLDKYGEYGEVTEMNYPIVTVVGLPSVKLNEVVLFETGERGQVISILEDNLRVMLFSQTRVRIGAKLSRTDEHLTVPVGKDLLGKLITPFGIPLSAGSAPVEGEETRLIDIPPGGISGRVDVTQPFATGTALVDIVIPLGKGQKELVLGDRKTGKSTFVLSTVKNQIREGAIAIYAVIGKKKPDIKYLEEFMNEDEVRKDNMIIVATSSFDSPGLIFLTPFTAMTIAEYFRDQGKDVLLVLDDLLTHAKFYREYSLLAETFPGRDSYPGDVFYIHAKLLERAGNFKHEDKGQTAISCFPIVETQDGDLTSYIVSNLMSITDGHLFFDSNVFSQGRRPAINIPLSVSRVGRQTQDRIAKDVNRELNSVFAIYEKFESLSHFGSEMSESVKSIFSIGEKVYQFFNQPAGMTLPREVYMVLFALVWLNILEDAAAIEKARDNLLIACRKDENRLLLKSLLDVESFNDYLKNVRENKDVLFRLWSNLPN